jgi:hypothetical protein
MKAFTLLFALLSINISFGQTDWFEVNEHRFVTKTTMHSNEWGTKDTLNKLYRIEAGKEVHVLDYYVYRDGGGDCNNLFWNREYIQLQGDSITCRTAYFQKTNMDPIPTERKQIYLVNNEGKFNLIFDKYRYRDNTTWVNQ